MTTVIELWGGPGCGKSTLAAGVYATMKAQGRSVELVREYVKAWAWRGTPIRKWDELYIFAKQLRAESDLYGKVDYVITDRPLGLSAVYEVMYNPDITVMCDTVKAVHWQREQEGVENVAMLVTRTKDYVAEGRFESEESAHQVDRICKWYLRGAAVEVSTVTDVLTRLGL